MSVLKVILSFFILFTIVGLLLSYWFLSFKGVEFKIIQKNSNFSVGLEDFESMQFYPNMRYPSSDISYKIQEKCSLQKKDEMERAFKMLGETTVLNFYPVAYNENIFVACEEKDITRTPGLFIAGEGGPTKVIIGSKFYIILEGQILLLKTSNCPQPNIALHELLHTLGFDHSSNENNVMYPITRCGQTIGDDIPIFLNTLYSIPNYPDLSIGDVSAKIEGRYLNINITIKNEGLSVSEDAYLRIYTDERLVKEHEINPIDIGEGMILTFNNILITKINIKELNFIIDADFNELEKQNNKVTLEIKN